MNLLESLRKNPFVLAPMAGITDHAFRSFMKELGASVVITELVSANGIDFQNDRTFRLMSFDETQRPVGIQLFGEDPEILARAAQVAQSKGADFVDLNFGCPVPKVVKKGAGSAMLRNLPALGEVLRQVKKSISIPLTIKIRTGWEASSRNAIDVCRLAFDEGVTWVAIHGRTRAQGYSGAADWDYIAEVKAHSQIPILGNGDLTSPVLAVERLRSAGCDGVMIGRGCLKNPLIFQQALKLWQGETGPVFEKPNFKSVLLGLHQHLSAHCEPSLVGLQMKKFAAWFSSGYPGASQFRKNIFQSKSNEEIFGMTFQFFDTVSQQPPEDTSQEAFLMGGHG